MIQKLHYIVLLITMLCMSSCNRDLLNDHEDISLSLNKIMFTEDYKTITIEGSLTNDSLKYDLCDSLHTELKVYGCGDYLDTLPARVSPKITQIRNVAKEQFAALDMQALVVVDRTMEQPLVDNAYKLVKNLCRFLDQSDIYISFIDSRGALTPTQVLTSDVLSQDFLSTSFDGNDKYLYHAIYDKLREAVLEDSPFTGENHFIVVVTDGIVWNEDKPYDPEHFNWQQNLLNLAETAGDRCPVFYTLMNDEFGMPLDVNNTMKSVCDRTQGACFDASDPDIIHQSICAIHNLPHTDYRFILEYPDNRVLSGEHINLFIEGVQDGVVRLHSSIDYQKGTWFSPIIVHGLSDYDMLIKCLLIGLLMLLIVYQVLQIQVPYIKNKLFERKYMADYTGPNMSLAGRQVPEVCYFCKTPFQPGDKIVASCEHAMHKECWEENNYRCPEHGITCKEDVHYANMKKPFSLSNAPYYMSWVLVALVANMVRYCLSYSISGEIQKTVLYFIMDLLLSDEMAQQASEFCFRNPHSIGIMAMCFVAAIAFQCRRHEPVKKQITAILLRAGVAYIVGYLIAVIDITVCTLFNIKFYHDLVGILDYLLVIAVAYAIISFRSPIRLVVKKIYGVLVLLLIFGYLITHNFYMDQRELYFLLFAVIYVAMALSVAFDTSRIWHCFLRVEGSVKKIDVALFKWILARPNVPVTMGRSVDCTLQITWDAKNAIAPLQAQIREYHGTLCLFPAEPGVTDEKDAPLPVEKPLKLYHGTRFKIGDLIFTYLEKY